MRIFLALAILLLAWACSPESSSEVTGEPSSSAAITGKTTSGYPYVWHQQHGGKKPEVGSRVKYHHKIYKNDSSIVSSYLSLQPKKAVIPEKQNLPNPVPPEYDALMMMSPGDCMTVYQLLDTFSVAQLPPGITNQDTFIYILKVLDIENAVEVQAELNAIKAREATVADTVQTMLRSFKDKVLTKDLITTDSGVSYKILKSKNGAKPESGQFVRVHYSGFLQSDGSNFDNTFKDAVPFTFRYDRKLVIPGWDELVGKLGEGDQAVVFIPYSQAYGVAGKPPGIPEKADLVFFIELNEIVNFSQ